MEDNPRSLTKVVMNTVSDPAVLLTTGGSITLADQSPIAAAINLTTVFVSGSVRAVSELKNEGYEIHTSKLWIFSLTVREGHKLLQGVLKWARLLMQPELLIFPDPKH